MQIIDHLSQTQLDSLQVAFGKARIAVIGDIMLDRYLFGTVSRLSPEAPVPILDIHRDEVRLGGAANVGHNIHTLSATALLIGVVGDDSKGRRVRQLLEEIGLSSAGIITDPDRPTTIKTRVIAGSQQMLRVDFETREPVQGEVERELGALALSKLRETDIQLTVQMPDEDRKDWLFLSMPVISAVLGVGLVQLGRYASRTEGPFLTRLIVEATEAKPKKAGPRLSPPPQ